jgi:hypothetical protein
MRRRSGKVFAGLRQTLRRLQQSIIRRFVDASEGRDGIGDFYFNFPADNVHPTPAVHNASIMFLSAAFSAGAEKIPKPTLAPLELRWERRDPKHPAGALRADECGCTLSID